MDRKQKERVIYSAETHSYDELYAAKLSVDTSLHAAKMDLVDLRRNSKITKKLAPADEYRAKQMRIIKLGHISQIIQREMGIAKRKKAAEHTQTVQACFMTVCREELEPDDMRYFMDEAMKRAKGACHVN